MISSLKSLFRSPYNRAHPVMAMYRFFYWKWIRLMKKRNVPFKVWENRKLMVNYDSFHSMWLMYNYIVDWEEFNLIRDYLGNGDVVADVGANMGYYTVWMSKFIGNGKVHSFEPDQENFKRLMENCSLNKLANVSANNVALSNQSGSLLFTSSLDGENHLSLDATKGTVKVEALTFDEYSKMKEVSNYTYVKVDIEGFEYFFLQGATALIKNKLIDIIQLEINAQVKNSNTSIDDLLLLISRSGYALCRYDVAQKQLVEIKYGAARENYFAVSNVEQVNRRLADRFNQSA